MTLIGKFLLSLFSCCRTPRINPGEVEFHEFKPISFLELKLVPLLTALKSWPIEHFNQELYNAAHAVSNEMESIQSHSRESFKESCVWLEWTDYMHHLLYLAESAGFHDANFLLNLSPFVHLHIALLSALYETEFVRQFKNRYSIVPELLSDFPSQYYGGPLFVSDVPRLYRPFSSGGIGPNTLRAVLAKLPLPRDDSSAGVYFAVLESLFSEVSLSSSPRSVQIRDVACTRFSTLADFVRGVDQYNVRRRNRLVFSILSICKPVTQLEERILLFSMPLIPATLQTTEPSSFDITGLTTQEWRDILEHQDLFPSLLVRICKNEHMLTPEIGFPRRLGIMFDHYLTPDNGIFEYSDESKIFIKPTANAPRSALIAAGRLIGLGLWYSIPIGAKLTPCALELLRIPRYQDRASRDCDFGSIYPQMTVIAKGINSFTSAKYRSLELFTDSEFQYMVHGRADFPFAVLQNGISISEPIYSQVGDWLMEILQEQDDDFRFGFNRLVTGVAQPPLKTEQPWIFVQISPDQLRPQSSCGGLILQCHSSKEALFEDLRLALTDSSHS